MAKAVDFIVGSLNVRGINNKIKRTGVFEWAGSKKFDVLMLQECYCSQDIETQWSDEWGGKCLFSHGTEHGKVTMILLKRAFDIEIDSSVSDNSGRYIIVKSIIQGEPFILINVYAPNTMKEKLTFFKDLCNSIEGMNISNNDNIIMAGDWNSIQQVKIDKYGGRELHCNTVVNSMRELLGQFDLVDIWRILNPEKRRYTFRQKTPLILSRLDYYMVSNSLQDNIVKTDIIPSIWSDHSAITLFVKHLPPTKKGNGYWKFNSSLVSDNKYVTDLCTEIEKWQQKYETMQDDRIIWELFKYEIRKFTMSYCSQKKLDKNLHESLKLKELEELEENLSLNPSDESILKIEQVRKEIRDIEEEKIKGSIIRSKIRWVEEGEKSSKFFFNLEKQNYIKKQVRKLTLNNGITVTDQQTIGKEMESFYSKLYKSELNYNKLDNTFFTSEKIPTISNIERDIIDAPITIEECKITLNTFKKNKSPGNDGLTYEFYDKFWNIISNILIKSYHAAFEKGELTVSQRQAIITLLEKPGKDRQLLKNWRPISLLNLDYKILSKTLSLRIQKYLPNLIHENQSGFVEGRYIGDSVRAVQDMMAFTELNKKDGIFLLKRHSIQLNGPSYGERWKLLNLEK